MCIRDRLMPVPALSFATRYLHCDAGIMVTASHNPAKYNGYKAYGPDGCQMTEEAADAVYAEMQKTDLFNDVATMPFEDALAAGKVCYIGEEVIDALYRNVEAQAVRPGICKTAGLKLVYSPLNGSGNVPVRHVLEMCIRDSQYVQKLCGETGHGQRPRGRIPSVQRRGAPGTPGHR